MTAATATEPPPDLIRGRWRPRRVPVWDVRVERVALAIARLLDGWQSTLPEPRFEVLNSPGFQLRTHPPTLFRVPLAVVPGRVPTLETDWVPGLPLLAVEVWVGEERLGDLRDRVLEYLQAGVPLVWVVEPDFRTVTIHQPGRTVRAVNVAGTLSADPELPGFSARVADFFR